MTAKRYSVSENIYEGPRAGASFTVVMEADYAALEQRCGELAAKVAKLQDDPYIGSYRHDTAAALAERDSLREALAARDETMF